jgi:uncharacterized protein (TIGR02145 family)
LETQDTLSVTIDPLSVTFDTLTDTRDGKTYRTVKIGKQVWMAENMNYKPQTGKSWCYNDSDSYCKKYGRLYDLEAAMTVCPEGWHLPTAHDWDDLTRAVGGTRQYYEGKDMSDRSFYYWDGAGKKLKAKNGWNSFKGKSGNGTDEYGFSALSGGYRYRSDGSFYGAGNYNFWWTATKYYVYYAYVREMFYNNEGVRESASDSNNGQSVRCIHDH